MGAMSPTLFTLIVALLTASADPVPVGADDAVAPTAEAPSDAQPTDPADVGPESEPAEAAVRGPNTPEPVGDEPDEADTEVQAVAPDLGASRPLEAPPESAKKKPKQKITLVPYAGVEFHPYSRQDAVWVDENRTSGLSVGEFDGTIRPTLGGFVGTWIGDFIGLHLGLGVARLQTTTWVGETYQQRHWGVVRPSIEGRFAFIRREARWPIPWGLLGVYVDIPSARDVSNGYSEEEQQAADETAQVERLTLWGVGGRAGLGVDYRLLPGIAVGAQFTVGWHQAILAGQDQAAVSSWLATEAAVLLIFEWPGKAERDAWRDERLNRRSQAP